MRGQRFGEGAVGCSGYHERWRRLDGVYDYDEKVQEVQQALGKRSNVLEKIPTAGFEC